MMTPAADHVDNEDIDAVPIQDSIGRMQNTPIINESGMCFLVLGRRNLTDAQKTYLIGRQYEAQKMTVGGNRGNQYSKVAKVQNGLLPKARTADIVAAVGIHDGIDCSKLSSGFSLMRCRQKEKPRTNPGLDKAGKTAIMKIEKGAAASG